MTAATVQNRMLAIPGGSGAATEEFATIGQLNGSTIRHRSAGFCAKTGNFNFSTDLNRVRSPPQPDQGIRRTEFETPVGDFSIAFLDVDIKPRVRVGEFNFRNSSVHFDRLVYIELRGEGMVSGHRNRKKRQCQA